jgi:hypothetical protein
MIFFSIACAVSAFSLATKVRYLVRQLRSRFAGQLKGKANASVVPVALNERSKSAIELQSQIAKSAFERTRRTLAGVLAMLEVRPPFA